MVQYYTLEQAAQVLQTTPDQLKAMAKKNEVRAFQDRGNLRFRAQEIDELARSRGLGSDPELPLGEALKSTPPAAPRRKSKMPQQEPIAFLEDDEAPIGKEPLSSSGSKAGPASSARKSGLGSRVGRKSTLGQPSAPKSPPPRATSDSDVRLVAEGSDLDFQVTPEEPRSPAPAPSTPSAKSGRTRPSKLAKGQQEGESGVRIMPLDEASDSDVKLSPDSGIGESALAGPSSAKKPSDSDIRLDDSSKDVKRGKGKKGDHPITEEIDLDEEQQRADAAARTQAGQGKTRPKANPLNLPTSSPFELSEADIDMDEPPAKTRPRAPKTNVKKDDADSSSDFELTPIGGADPSPLELSSGETAALQADDSDEVSLGELTGAGAARSGINLQDPADSGISLEQGGSDEIEFELSLDAGATPKPGKVDHTADSSSEFELAVDSDEAPADEEDSSSEFELSLDAEDSGEQASTEQADSDSEFELTLDADGGLESSGETDALAGDDEDEKDIFETDFEVPALEEEESGSEAVVLEDEDTDLETSDFDLALDEEGSADEEDAESGSQVVALEDGETEDEGAETEARPRRRSAVAEDDEESDLDLEIDPMAETEDEEEEVAVGAGAEAAAPPARWGTLPALLMLPSVAIMFFVGLLAFELAGTQWNYRQPGRTTGFGLVLHPIAKYFDSSLPD